MSNNLPDLPEILKDEKGNFNPDWYKKNKVKEKLTLAMAAKAKVLESRVDLPIETLKALIYLIEFAEQQERDHTRDAHNAIVAIAAAAIEKNPEMAYEYLTGHLDNCEFHEWQVYDDASVFCNEYTMRMTLNEQQYNDELKRLDDLYKRDTALWEKKQADEQKLLWVTDPEKEFQRRYEALRNKLAPMRYGEEIYLGNDLKVLFTPVSSGLFILKRNDIVVFTHKSCKAMVEFILETS